MSGPAIFLAGLIYKYGVNSPVLDDWDVTGLLIQKILDGSFSLGDLWAQHIEARQVFPRLIFLPLAFMSHWNLRLVMFFSWFLAGLTALNLFWLARATISHKKHLFYLVMITSVLIFSPIQYAVWLSGYQMIYLVPGACLSAALLVIYKNGINFRLKFIAGLFLCVVSTFSLTNGMLLWFLAPMALVFSENQSPPDLLKSGRWKILWTLAGFICAGLYFYNYNSTGFYPVNYRGMFHQVFLLEFYHHPLMALQFFVALFSLPFGLDKLEISFFLGLAGLTLWLALVFYFLRRRPKIDRALFPAVPWMLLGAYSVASAMMITVGRLGYSIICGSILPPLRYSTPAVYLAVSIAALMIMVFDQTEEPKIFSKNLFIFRFTGFFLLIFFMIFQARATLVGLRLMRSDSWQALRGKTCVRFLNIFPDEVGLALLHPAMNILTGRANFLSDRGFISPPIYKKLRMDQIAARPAPGCVYGSFDNIEKDSGSLVASGWAVLPDRKKPAEAVILTYENEKEPPVIFKTVFAFSAVRPEVAKFLNNRAFINSGWSAKLSEDSLPGGLLTIRAWAFDLEKMKAFPLGGPKKFPKIL